VDCELGMWGSFSPCSLTCGDDGVQARTRQVIVEPLNNGTQ